MQVFINGTYATQENALVSILDLGLLRGYGVFDYLRTYENRPFHLQDHLERLHYSASQVGMDLPYSFSSIEQIIQELLQKSPHQEHSIKLVVTGGLSEDQLFPSTTSSFFAFAYPLQRPASTAFTQGVRVLTTRHKRSFPHCKTTQYLGAIVALQEGKKHNASEVLYLNDNNEVQEATTSNFFAFREGTLLTPPEEGILLGITREVVLRLCAPHFPTIVRPIMQRDLPFLDEAFLTASNKEIMPISHIDGLPIGKGTVGPLTQKVMHLFAEYTKQATWSPLRIARYASIPPVLGK